jgi:hypothetical protein
MGVSAWQVLTRLMWSQGADHGSVDAVVLHKFEMDEKKNIINCLNLATWHTRGNFLSKLDRLHLHVIFKMDFDIRHHAALPSLSP